MRKTRRADVLLEEAEEAKRKGLREAERFLLDRAAQCLRPRPASASH